ncbi:hypothetical protein QNA24_30285 [Rhodococcus qingshengii]|uniref:hypothetical protein n=1 Tax=Rhodococcus TaxID=1827 RepID=UPI001E2BD5A3|nr:MULTISPECIES: hypothetical protein [Rhodococcus]MCD2099539.1 hypothetical protein [Rhodococcus rhodochrous]MCD2123907.1 hypothetical protein [Rhodococcus rhodochrous]MCQ4136666.1 hypothetical protein [Rhodococcus rhodochrous]MDJ0490673.1 hypothetical protein [Rhodococcus qingshengii]
MSFVYRYTGTDQVLTVKSDERRFDLEGWACWERVEAGVKPAETVTESVVEVEAEAPAVEVEEPKKPARRTRAKKPAADTEVED